MGSLDEGGLPLDIELSHAPNMSSKVSAGDKLCERRLFEQWWVLGSENARGVKRIRQIGRHHQVGQAQRREHDFAECAEVDDAVLTVEPLQSRQRAAGLAVFAVIVVFEDPGVCMVGPFQQL